MKKNFKKVIVAGLTLLMVVGAFLLSSKHTAQAQSVQNGNGYYVPQFWVNSANALYGTNAHFGVTTNGSYPIGLLGTDIVTNFAAGPYDITGFKVITLQCTASASTNVGALTGQQVVFTLYKSVSGGLATNSFGSNILFDTYTTVTLPITSSTTGPWTVVTNFTDYLAPITGAFKVYIGKIDTTGMTNNSYLTNYSVRFAGEP